MDSKDLLITPIFFLILTLLAFWIRPSLTNKDTIKYFMPALYLKFFGAIILGVIYQFYYNGGDTFNYFSHGSIWIWQAFWDNPALALKLFLSKGEVIPEVFGYSSRIWYYRDSSSYFVVKLVAFIDIFTWHTYSATALFFAFFSFIGGWKLYQTFCGLYPTLFKEFALATLFIPSMIFWGSGILKDTLTFGALGWVTYSIFEIVQFRNVSVKNIIIFLFFSWLIFSVKKYILICYLAGLVIWFYGILMSRVKQKILKVLLMPLLVLLFSGLGYLSIDLVSRGDSKYSLDNLASTAAVTAHDIRYGWGARGGDNSGYTLGQLDGSWQSMLRLFPSAVNVSLFRPYLWEVKNPLMLLSSLESLILLLFTIKVVTRPINFFNALKNPHVRFCLGFSLLFAFSVGVSTFNFGTLARYKIPMLPFYGLFLVILLHHTRKLP